MAPLVQALALATPPHAAISTVLEQFTPLLRRAEQLHELVRCAGTQFDPDVIDRIEVISGAGATLWGANAVNGVVNEGGAAGREGWMTTHVYAP